MFKNSFMSPFDDVPHEREVTIIGDFVFAFVADTTTAFNVFEYLYPVNRGKNLVIRFNDFHIKAPLCEPQSCRLDESTGHSDSDESLSCSPAILPCR